MGMIPLVATCIDVYNLEAAESLKIGFTYGSLL
jgi:hypothetical protein